MRRWVAAVLVALTVLVIGVPAGHGDDDLAKAHDYDTVDISTLGELELTFVPEWRKAPALKKLLRGRDWRLRQDLPQAPFCSALLSDFITWRDVEIVLRANRFDDPAFAAMREQCPNLIPHKDEGQSKGAAAFYYSTHHFKTFEIPSPGRSDAILIFYAEGSAPSAYIDHLGNIILGEPDEFVYGGGGIYRILDLDACKERGSLKHIMTDSFGFYAPERAEYGFSESAIVRIGSSYFLLTGRRWRGTYFPPSHLAIHSFSGTRSFPNSKDQLIAPACRFVVTVAQPE